MADIIDFDEFKKKRGVRTGTSIPGTAQGEHHRASNFDWSEAAKEICAEIGNKFRFFTMREGLPEDENVLYNLAKQLSDSLHSLAKEFGASTLYDLSLSGVHVYFSQEKTKLEIDAGYLSLYLNNEFSAGDIDRLVRPLLRVR